MIPSGNRPAESSVGSKSGAELIENPTSESCCSPSNVEPSPPLQHLTALGGAIPAAPRELVVDFLEVEMANTGSSGCSACDSVRGQLDATVDALEPIIAELGVRLSVRATLVRTEEEVRRLGVRGSPTIRIGEVSLFPEHCGMGEERVWSWRGKEYNSPPRALLLHTILRGYVAWAGTEMVNQPAGRAPDEEIEIPIYLRQFLAQESRAEALKAPEHHCC